MTCPLCARRPAKRSCPAKQASICPTCCATKRLREIACPDSCPYLASARAHPPAVEQRRRERDVSLLLRLVEGLSPLQLDVCSILTAEIRRHRETAAPRPIDADVAEAARAQAATLETAAKGILYEHQPASIPAQRLARLFRDLVLRLDEQQPIPPSEAAEVFRRLEAGAQAAARPDADGPSAFLDALDRLADAAAREGTPAARSAPRHPASADAPRIVLP